MSGYATLADLITRFSERELTQLSDREGTGTVDQAVVDQALLDAEAEIEARLQPRYTLPLASVPRLLVNIACDIARYRLYDDRSTDQVTRRYEDAVKLLDRIGRGEISLGLDAADQATPSTSSPRIDVGDRTFSRGLLGDYAG